MMGWLRSEQGSEIVEFALIGPILLFLVLMAPILGLTVRSWLVIEGAAREGARTLAVNGDVNKACERAFAVVDGTLPRNYGSIQLFDRNSISLTVSQNVGKVTVRYNQPTYIPGLGLLLNDPGDAGEMDNYWTLMGEATYLVEIRSYSDFHQNCGSPQRAQ